MPPMAAAGKILRGGCHSLALTGTTSAPRIPHRGSHPLCGMEGAGSVRATAGRWQPLRPNCRQTAIAGRLTHGGATGCRPRLGAGRAARPGHHGGRGAAPLCVWGSAPTRLLHPRRARSTQVSKSSVCMIRSRGEWPPRVPTPYPIPLPPPAAREPHPTRQGKPRRLAASQLFGVRETWPQPTVQKVVYGAMWSD